MGKRSRVELKIQELNDKLQVHYEAARVIDDQLALLRELTGDSPKADELVAPKKPARKPKAKPAPADGLLS